MAQVHGGPIGNQIMKEPRGFTSKVPTGYMGGYFLKVLTMYLVGNNQVNCFRTLNELTMDLLGKCPLPPVKGAHE